MFTNFIIRAIIIKRKRRKHFRDMLKYVFILYTYSECKYKFNGLHINVHHFQLRASAPDCFGIRDPLLPAMQNVYTATYVYFNITYIKWLCSTIRRTALKSLSHAVVVMLLLFIYLFIFILASCFFLIQHTICHIVGIWSPYQNSQMKDIES